MGKSDLGCKILKLSFNIPFGRLVTFNEFPLELFTNKAQFFHKIAVWQKIRFGLLEEVERLPQMNLSYLC